MWLESDCRLVGLAARAVVAGEALLLENYLIRPLGHFSTGKDSHTLAAIDLSCEGVTSKAGADY